MRDRCSTVLFKLALSPRRVTNSSAAQVGIILDTLGWEFAVFTIALGAMTDADATFAVLLEEGNDPALADAAPVADVDMVSQTDGVAPETAAAWTFANDNEIRKIEYIGDKRYIRLTITPTNNNAGSADMGAGCRLGSPQQALVTQTQS